MAVACNPDSFLNVVSHRGWLAERLRTGKKMTNLSGATLGDGVVIGRLMHDWGATTWQ